MSASTNLHRHRNSTPSAQTLWMWMWIPVEVDAAVATEADDHHHDAIDEALEDANSLPPAFIVSSPYQDAPRAWAPARLLRDVHNGGCKDCDTRR